MDAPDKSKRPLYVFLVSCGAAVLTVLVVMNVLSMGRGPKNRVGLETSQLSRLNAGLLQSLQDPRTRVATALELGKNKDTGGLEVLRRMTWKSSDTDFRAACIWSLGEIGDPGSVQCLSTVFRTASEPLRAAAVEAASKLPCEEAAWIVQSGMSDDAERVRVAAAAAAARRSEEAVIRALGEATGVDQPREVRLAALKSLAGGRAEKVANTVICWLRDADPEIRAAAATALSGIGKVAGQQAREAVAAARTAVSVRRAAQTLTAGKPAMETVPSLIQALDRMAGTDATPDDKESVLRKCVESMSQLGEPVLDELDRLVVSGESSALAKNAMARVCRSLGRPAADVLERRIMRWRIFPGPDELRLLVATLGEIGDMRAFDALDHAAAQAAFMAGLAETVDAARGKIASRAVAGPPDPAAPATPSRSDAAAPGPAVGIRGRRAYPQVPPVEVGALPPVPRIEVGAFPPDAVFRVALAGALRGETGRCDLVVELDRRNGEWGREVWGKAPGFNRAEHQGVLTQTGGGGLRFHIEMAIQDDAWIRGGFGEFDIDLERSEEGIGGKYRGRYNMRDAAGNATVRVYAVRPAPRNAADLELDHPRLFAGRADLAGLRARLTRPAKRAAVAALLSRLDRVPATLADRLDRTVAHAVLSALFDDAVHGSRAGALASRCIRDPGEGDILDPVRKVGQIAAAFDLGYHHIEEADRVAIESYLSRFGGVVRPGAGFVSLYGSESDFARHVSACGNVGLAALSLAGTPLPFALGRPRAPTPVTVVEADRALTEESRGPVNAVRPGELIRDWVVAAPAEAADIEALARQIRLSGVADGMQFRDGDMTCLFRTLATNAVETMFAAGQSRERVHIEGAGSESRAILAGMLRVETMQGVRIRLSHPYGYQSARMWVSGSALQDGDVAILNQGMHGVVVEVVGSVVCPMLESSDVLDVCGRWQRYQLLLREWKAAEKRQKGGPESAFAAYTLAVAGRNAFRALNCSAGAGEAFRELLPFAWAYERIAGASLISSRAGWSADVDPVKSAWPDMSQAKFETMRSFDLAFLLAAGFVGSAE